MSIDIIDEDNDLLHLSTHEASDILIMELITGDCSMLRFNRAKDSSRNELMEMVDFITEWLKKTPSKGD